MIYDVNLCGIDEAGRGCIAGDLAVAGVVLHKDIPMLKDSKKLSESKRKQLEILIKENSNYHIEIVPPAQIDLIGLSKAIANSLIKIKNILKVSNYIFDGNSSFGVDGIKTLVKADTKIAQVMAASILAKTARDRLIINLDSYYDKWDFKSNKGYGTKKHKELIKKYGFSNYHRLSFNIK
jgi:ribonuclease HII